jgi:uncharacterized protein (UPF0297 family)
MKTESKKTKQNCLRDFDDIKFTEGFTKAPNEIIFDKKVKPMSLRVYLAIADLKEEDKKDFQPMKIQKKLDIKWDAFMKAMKNLADCGYVLIETKAEVKGYDYHYYSVASYKKHLNKSESIIKNEKPIEKQIPTQIDYSNALENKIVNFINELIKYPIEDKIDTQNAALNYIENTRKNIEHFEKENLIEEKFKEEEKIKLITLEHFCIERLERLYNLNLEIQ